MYDTHTFPWDINRLNKFPTPSPYQEPIIQSYTYNPTEALLKQGYFLNKNMTLTGITDFTYFFNSSDLYISFNKNTYQVVVTKENIVKEKLEVETLFNGKIKTEKEMEVLLGQLNIKL